MFTKKLRIQSLIVYTVISTRKYGHITTKWYFRNSQSRNNEPNNSQTSQKHKGQALTNASDNCDSAKKCRVITMMINMMRLLCLLNMHLLFTILVN